jgi:integrase
MALTDRTIRNAKPRSSVYRIRDGNPITKGFGLAVAPAGSKTFFLSYTSPATGRRTQIKLGRYPDTSLKDAREKAKALRGQLENGADPQEAVVAERRRREELAARPTVSALFDAYITDLEMDGKRSAREVRRIFEKHIRGAIGGAIAADVTSDDILDIVAPIVQRGSPVHADNVRAYLRAAFEFGVHLPSSARWRGRAPRFGIDHNPVANTKRAVRRKPVGTRTLSFEEVRTVWTCQTAISLPSHLALKLLITTGQRVEEVLQAPWTEFDLGERLWTIPAERRKTRHQSSEPHIVPLVDLHLGLLEEIRKATDHPKWLFPHKDREQPRKADALYQAVHRYCRASGTEPFAPRDCRRTFKTLAGSIGIDLEMRNRLQGHAMTDVGSIHYDRWSYLPEKRSAMAAWCDWLKRKTRNFDQQVAATASGKAK